MKTLPFFFFAAVTLALAYADTYTKQHEEVQARVESSEAFWTARDTFNVGVADDGSRRDDYARHVCKVLYDYGFKGKRVWVMVFDVVDYSELGKLKDLGGTQCR